MGLSSLTNTVNAATTYYYYGNVTASGGGVITGAQFPDPLNAQQSYNLTANGATAWELNEFPVNTTQHILTNKGYLFVEQSQLSPNSVDGKQTSFSGGYGNPAFVESELFNGTENWMLKANGLPLFPASHDDFYNLEDVTNLNGMYDATNFNGTSNGTPQAFYEPQTTLKIQNVTLPQIAPTISTVLGGIPLSTITLGNTYFLNLNPSSYGSSGGGYFSNNYMSAYWVPVVSGNSFGSPQNAIMNISGNGAVGLNSLPDPSSVAASGGMSSSQGGYSSGFSGQNGITYSNVPNSAAGMAAAANGTSQLYSPGTFELEPPSSIPSGTQSLDLVVYYADGVERYDAQVISGIKIQSSVQPQSISLSGGKSVTVGTVVPLTATVNPNINSNDVITYNQTSTTVKTFSNDSATSSTYDYLGTSGTTTFTHSVNVLSNTPLTMTYTATLIDKTNGQMTSSPQTVTWTSPTPQICPHVYANPSTGVIGSYVQIVISGGAPQYIVPGGQVLVWDTTPNGGIWAPPWQIHTYGYSVRLYNNGETSDTIHWSDSADPTCKGSFVVNWTAAPVQTGTINLTVNGNTNNISVPVGTSINVASSTTYTVGTNKAIYIHNLPNVTNGLYEGVPGSNTASTTATAYTPDTATLVAALQLPNGTYVDSNSITVTWTPTTTPTPPPISICGAPPTPPPPSISNTNWTPDGAGIWTVTWEYHYWTVSQVPSAVAGGCPAFIETEHTFDMQHQYPASLTDGSISGLSYDPGTPGDMWLPVSTSPGTGWDNTASVTTTASNGTSFSWLTVLDAHGWNGFEVGSPSATQRYTAYGTNNQPETAYGTPNGNPWVYIRPGAGYSYRTMWTGAPHAMPSLGTASMVMSNPDTSQRAWTQNMVADSGTTSVPAHKNPYLTSVAQTDPSNWQQASQAPGNATQFWSFWTNIPKHTISGNGTVEMAAWSTSNNTGTVAANGAKVDQSISLAIPGDGNVTGLQNDLAQVFSYPAWYFNSVTGNTQSQQAQAILQINGGKVTMPSAQQLTQMKQQFVYTGGTITG